MVKAVSSRIRSTAPKKKARLGTIGPPTEPPNCCRLNGFAAVGLIGMVGHFWIQTYGGSKRRTRGHAL